MNRVRCLYIMSLFVPFQIIQPMENTQIMPYHRWISSAIVARIQETRTSSIAAPDLSKKRNSFKFLLAYGAPEEVEDYLKINPEKNPATCKQGKESALLRALRGRRERQKTYEIVKIILSKVKSSELQQYVNHPDAHGITPLHQAAWSIYSKPFIQDQATDYCIHDISLITSPSIIPSTCDKSGDQNYPYRYEAIFPGCHKLVSLLIAKGASKESLDINNHTPFQLAKISAKLMAETSKASINRQSFYLHKREKDRPSNFPVLSSINMFNGRLQRWLLHQEQVVKVLESAHSRE